MNEQDQDAMTNRNVGQLHFTGEALERAAMRRTGGALASTQDLMGQILETERQLRRELEDALQQLAAEREARQHLEAVIRNVADVVVNGRKAKGT